MDYSSANWMNTIGTELQRGLAAQKPNDSIVELLNQLHAKEMMQDNPLLTFDECLENFNSENAAITRAMGKVQ